MENKTLKRPVLTVLLFFIIGLAFYVMWDREFPFTSKDPDRSAEKSEQTTGPMYSLQPLVVELSGTYINVIPAEEGGQPRLGTRKKYLWLTIDLELRDKGAVSFLKKKKDLIIPAVTSAASSKKAKDIETVEGKTALGNEIAEKLNESLQQECVVRVHFKDFVIQ